MAVDQIQIKWKSGGGQSYEDSIAALKQYGEVPSLKGSVILKGNWTQVAIDQCVASAQAMTLDAKMAFELSYADADSIPRYIGSINCKSEEYSKDGIDQLIAMGQELGLEALIVLTATWGNNQEVPQMQLFPPPQRRQTNGRARMEDPPAQEPRRGTPENPDDFDQEEAVGQAELGV